MPNGNTVKHGWILLCMCTPLYNETLRGCFTVGEKKKYQKIDDNGELVIEWKKEKSIKVVVVENICYDQKVAERRYRQSR